MTSMRAAPASIAFSTNSLTAAAGRSMTSPAAMRLTRTGGRRRIAIIRVYANGGRDHRNQERGMRRRQQVIQAPNISNGCAFLLPSSPPPRPRSSASANCPSRSSRRSSRAASSGCCCLRDPPVDERRRYGLSCRRLDRDLRREPVRTPLRDIHTVSQQVQGRQEHFETVGQYLLGLTPDTLAWLSDASSPPILFAQSLGKEG